MKRKFTEEICEKSTKQKVCYTYDPILSKRKCVSAQVMEQNKRKRHDDGMDDIRREHFELQRRNVELEQAVQTLVRKIQTLEYMLSMFQRNETIGSNRMVQAF